ncbi:hypothetical protein CGI18_07200 [Vibrio parahaemolyticus]|uniref:portal protein n=1 Tax=Vibrio parahaemolyticus TaxID=670 RepID=UPI0011219502|nr:hypothetical protein [Vibrio parahaemolyticus]TOK48271.1 hypothetical protein CGI18_07200 [Vibrio parahaemolyticus]
MATYLKKFKQEELEALSLQAKYYFDEADDGKQEKGKVYRDSYYSYKALIPNVMTDGGSCIDLSKRLPVEPVIRRATNQVLATAKNTLLNDQVHCFIYRSKKESIREEVAQAVTNRINDIILRENDGDKIFTQAFKEAIITGDSFVKYFIEEEKCVRVGTIEEPMPVEMAEVVTEEGKVYSLAQALEKFPDTLEHGDINLEFTTRKVEMEKDVVIPLEARAVVEAMAEQKDIEVTFNDESVTIGLDVVFVSGEVELVKVEEKIVIEFVPFQDIYVDRYLQDTDITKADYVCHRIPMARYEAHEKFEGADEEVLDLLQNIDTNVDYPYSNFKMNTQNAMTDGYEQTRSAADDMLNNVFVYEHYFKFKCPETKKYELMQICTATYDGRGVLDIQKIKTIPFVHYTAFPMNTSFWSESIHDYLYDEQVRQTTLSRSVSTYAQHGATLRFLASNNLSSQSKRALMDNRPGGVVFTDAPTDVVPMPTHQLSNAVIEGLNISKQSVQEEWSSSVGQDLIERGSNMSATGASLAVGQYEMKDKAICKNLSVGHVQLAMGILSLLSEDQQTVEVKMNYTQEEQMMAQQVGVPLDSVIQFPLEDLDAKGDFIPDVNTPNDLASQAQTLVQGIQFTAQFAPELLNAAGVYHAVDKVFEAASLYNTDYYINEPESALPVTKEQVNEMQVQLEERASAMAQAQHDLAISEANYNAMKSAQLVLENRQYQIDKAWEQEKEKVEVAMKSKELLADIRSQTIEDVLDVISTTFQMDRAVVEAQLTNKLGKNIKLGSYQL